MQIFERRTSNDTDVDVYVVETDDQEVIEFRGATPDEAKAKLDDFLSWAS